RSTRTAGWRSRPCRSRTPAPAIAASSRASGCGCQATVMPSDIGAPWPYVGQKKGGPLARATQGYISIPPGSEVLLVADVRHAAVDVVQLVVVERRAVGGAERRQLATDVANTQGHAAVPRNVDVDLRVEGGPRRDVDLLLGVLVRADVVGDHGGAEVTTLPGHDQLAAVVRTAEVAGALQLVGLHGGEVVGQGVGPGQLGVDPASRTDVEAVVQVQVDALGALNGAVDDRQQDVLGLTRQDGAARGDDRRATGDAVTLNALLAEGQGQGERHGADHVLDLDVVVVDRDRQEIGRAHV